MEVSLDWLASRAGATPTAFGKPAAFTSAVGPAVTFGDLVVIVPIRNV